jgi:hypothetical protein
LRNFSDKLAQQLFEMGLPVAFLQKTLINLMQLLILQQSGARTIKLLLSVLVSLLMNFLTLHQGTLTEGGRLSTVDLLALTRLGL